MTETTKRSDFLGWLSSRKAELVAFAVSALLVVIDQITKLAVAADFDVGQTKAVIEGVFHLTYVRNDGAVFGSLSGKPYIFNTVTVILVIAGIVALLSGKLQNIWYRWAAALVVSGGTGNMIDRIRLGYVIDFIDVRCFGRLWTWVFNIADCCVVIGCITLITYMAVDAVREIKAAKSRDKHTGGDETDAES